MSAHTLTQDRSLTFEQDRELDVLVKGAHDCWVAARQVGRRQLILVLEGRAEGGLLEASETARRFMTANMRGVLD